MALPFVAGSVLHAADLNLLAPLNGPAITGNASVAGTLTVGSGVNGLVAMPWTAGGYAGFYGANITASVSNYAFLTNTSDTWINSASTTRLGVLGVQVLTVTSTGAAVTGTLSSTGALSSLASVSAPNVVSTLGTFISQLYTSGNRLTLTSTPPTISSGFGTAPSAPIGSGAAFKVTIGTGGAASGVLTFPAATNGWAVDGECQTNTSTTQVVCVATSTTSVTVYAYSRTTGLASTFAAGETIVLKALGF